MRQRNLLLAIWLLSGAAAFGAANQVQTLGANLRLVPTFENCAIYLTYTGDANTNSVASLQWRKTGSGANYTNGLALWNDHATLQYKGTLFQLHPNTTYDVVVTVTDADGVPSPSSVTNTVTTWNDVPNVGSSAGWSTSITNTPQTISTYGSGVTSYRQYGPNNGSRMFFAVDANTGIGLTINADNILLQNIDFIGGTNNCVKVLGNRTNIWVRNCTFANWGWPTVSSGVGSVPDQMANAALCFGDTTTGGNYRLVVESCTVNPPKGGANSWATGHPTGPHGIFFTSTKGEIVCRYNRVYGSSGHYYNDGIGGYQNESTSGFVSNDSQVYGNIVSEVWDDAIEDDGGNQNVAIYGNILTNVHTAVSTAGNILGPSYVFRNYIQYNNDTSGVGFKRGISNSGSNNGAQWTINNTMIGPFPWLNNIDNSGGGNVYQVRHYNNNYFNPGSTTSIKDPTADWTSKYDYDLVPSGTLGTLPSGSEAHVMQGSATYVNTYYLNTGSLGYHGGTQINGITTDATGVPLSNPNVGAYDERFPVLLAGPQSSGGGADPNIVTQPQSQSIVVNTPVTFTVVATGTPTLTYQWNLNGANIAGATLSSYTIASVVQSQNGGVYTCGVTNGIGGVLSSNAVLTVTPTTPIIFYASVAGNQNNDGLSPANAWPLHYAIANAGQSNVVMVLPGWYIGGSTFVLANWMTVKSTVKWGAIISDIPGTAFDTTATDGSINGTVLDGLVISNSVNTAVIIRSGTNHVVRNCWVVDTGVPPGGASQSQSGIETIGSTANCLFENNLVERNGGTSSQGFNHGIYLGGTNHIVRNCVVRSNQTFGIQLYAHPPYNITGVQVYNNLVYNNGVLNADNTSDGIIFEPNYDQATAYIYGNTIIATNGYAIQGGIDLGTVATLYATNNILYSSKNGAIRFFSPAVMYSDYEVVTNATAFPGTHDVITNYFGFVNAPSGLYWLKSDSPARGKALSTVYGAVDFFGNAQNSMGDIGAFQFNGVYAGDSRTLDPSPGTGADYWAILNPPPPTGGMMVTNLNVKVIHVGGVQ